MIIYVGHSTSFDFEQELYQPLEHAIPQGSSLILPHRNSSEVYPSKELLTKRGCDLMLAEVSYPSTGLGIELGWASVGNVRIICIAKVGSQISSAIKAVAEQTKTYKTQEDLRDILAELTTSGL